MATEREREQYRERLAAALSEVQCWQVVGDPPVEPNGRRRCRQCYRDRGKKYRARIAHTELYCGGSDGD